jgi:hypothetical protein
VLTSLTPSDTGIYTCVASNLVGRAAKNFTVTVDQLGPSGGGNIGGGGSGRHEQPLLPGGPENTTVHHGDTASLECLVRSATPPNIKWLKKLETWEYEAAASSEDAADVIDLGSEKFVVIQKSSEDVNSAGEYVNRLEIPRAADADAGMYYCFVTNSWGYKFKNAYLTVGNSSKLLQNMDYFLRTTHCTVCFKSRCNLLEKRIA